MSTNRENDHTASKFLRSDEGSSTRAILPNVNGASLSGRSGTALRAESSLRVQSKGSDAEGKGGWVKIEFRLRKFVGIRGSVANSSQFVFEEFLSTRISTNWTRMSTNRENDHTASKPQAEGKNWDTLFGRQSRFGVRHSFVLGYLGISSSIPIWLP